MQQNTACDLLEIIAASLDGIGKEAMANVQCVEDLSTIAKIAEDRRVNVDLKSSSSGF